jgi:dipeptidyl aminopeptidase/acylaminoacyl peptidase
MRLRELCVDKLLHQKIIVNAAAILIFLASVPSLFAQGVTPEHISKMKTVSSTSISEDHQHIAYTVSVPTDPYAENAGNRTELYLYNREDGTTKPYYTAGGIGSISFRPGTNSITFLAKRNGDDTRSLYEVPLDGGEAVKVFSFERDISTYEWHNDGNHIAFTSYEETEESTSPLPYTADVYEENQANRKAYVTNVMHDHKDHTAHELNVEGTVYLMNWSPDGSKLAVSASPTPEIDDFYMDQQVFIVDYQTRNISAEVNNEGKLGQIEWSPDGNRIALRAGADIHDPIDGRILIVSANGGAPEIIDRDFEGKYEEISWTGNNEIHFLSSTGTSGQIGTISPDGSQKDIRFETDAHAINSFDRASDGTISFVASAPHHPSELYLLSGQINARPERITHHNNWLEDVELGRQEVIRYTSRDGEFEIEGMFIYPANYNAGDQIPVITVVHGGPEAHYSNGWLTSYSMPGQMAAGKGYGVFYPNYRGSTGRGIDFVYSSQGDLAGKEFDDIVDGVDYLISDGIADEDRIGVTGGSYGGYASAWMSTYYSDRFAAAVMFVGISNNISKWGTSDIPEELYLVHSRKRIWDDYQLYLENSPIYYVDRAQTPLLIMHGAEDPRVHPAQSLELFRHMKVRKPEVPLRLVWYPGEGHGNSRSSSKFDYNYRMLQWFDTYLMTGNASAEVPHWSPPIPEKE